MDSEAEMELILEKIRDMARKTPKKQEEMEVTADGADDDDIPDTLRCVSMEEITAAMNESQAVSDYARFEEAASKVIPSWDDPCN